VNAPRKAVFVPYNARTILNKHKRPDTWFWTRYTAYPYIGCQHGCHFCYCREQKYAPYDDIDDFPYIIKVKQNAPALLHKALSKLPRDVVAVGDYQPAERKFEISRRMLEVCLDLRFPVFLLERSPLVLRDLDLLQEINKVAHVSVLFSIIHTSISPHADRISRIERLAPPPEQRFAAMRRLTDSGITCGVSLMPILPGLCDTRENISAVIQHTRDHGGRFILAAPLTLADQQKAYFMRYLQQNEPALYPAYQDMYPDQSYAPASASWLKTARLVRGICQQHGLPDRMPRPILPGEKRALNKKAVEYLANQLYTMELEQVPDQRMWTYRKAAWSIEDTQQDIGLIYRRMGRKGLESIQHVGPTFARQLETLICVIMENNDHIQEEPAQSH
jgi:DNA repair photolyase